MHRQKPPNPKLITAEALAAAKLRADGKTQMEIATELHMTQTTVSRHLKEAEKYIEVQRKFRWDLLSAAMKADVERKLSNREVSRKIAAFAERSGRHTPTVHVVSVEKARIGTQFESFAIGAAPIVRDLLRDVGGRVGVAWGSTLWYTAQALSTSFSHNAVSPRPSIEFIPLCGDPLTNAEERVADRTASRIAVELSKVVNSGGPRPAWLGIVPAFIPSKFEGAEFNVIEDLIDLVPQYSRIFGPRKGQAPFVPLAADLHMILTAAGPAQRPRGGLLALTSEQSRLLTESICGDIGGVLLPRVPPAEGEDKNAGSRSLLDDLTGRWTGLKLEHLEACAVRGFAEQSPSRPGVTLLSFGESHTEVVLEAVRRGLSNHLIIGSDLETAIGERLPQPS